MNFCELDSHLQPWDKDTRLKKPWTESYDRARIWDMAISCCRHPKSRSDGRMPEVLAASGTQRAEVLWNGSPLPCHLTKDTVFCGLTFLCG
jgi:hypothetical protein